MQDMKDDIAHAFQASKAFVSATPPPQASDAAYTPQDTPLRGELAGWPSSFTAHGVGRDDLGSFPGGARASQIRPDLTGPQLTSPAATSDGYGRRGPGTPERMTGQPTQGIILDKLDRFGVLHLGIGPGVPLILLVAVGAVFLWTRKGGRS